MSDTNDKIASGLRKLANALPVFSQLFAVPPMAASLAAIALSAVAELIEAGEGPEVVIARLKDIRPALDKVAADTDAAAEKKFGPVGEGS